MWYWGAHGRDYAGDVIFVGGDPKSVARLGYRTAGTFRDALEMAKDTVGLEPVDHVLPHAAALDRGRAVRRRPMSGLRDELKEMSRGFRWGRRPLVPRSAEPFAEEHDDVGFPTDWARTAGGRRCRASDPEGRSCIRSLWNELSLRVFGLDNLEGVDGAGRVLLEPLEPPGRDADPDHAARRVAGEDRGRRGARLLLRRVVASGVHRARLRRVPDRPRARRRAARSTRRAS